MKLKKVLRLLVAICLVLVSLTACASSTKTASNPQATTLPDSQTKTDAQWKPFTVTDMGGRSVTFEKPVKKAFASNLIGILFIRSIDIAKLGGWTNPLSEDEKKFLPEQYWQLPMLGGWSSANPTANIEELVKANIDVIFVTAIVNPKIVDMANNIQSQTGIPTVIVSSDLNKLGAAYDLMGNVLENKDRAAILGKYCTDELAKTKEMIAKIPDDKRVTFYYAEGDQGLETDPSGSMHTQAFDFVKAINVAKINENTANGIVGQSVVSLEQVLKWNPQFIIRNSTYTAADPTKSVNALLNNPDWAGIDAVKNKKVYQTPGLPNNWIDRGPSVNRVLGVKWLANLFYPDYVKLDIRSEAKQYFNLFYKVDLTDQQLDYILAAS